MWGNNFWLGGERACYLLNNPPAIHMIRSAKRKMHENVTSIASKVPVEYRMFYASHQSTIQFDADLFNKSVLHIGLCLPQSCNQSESQTMAEHIFESHSFEHQMYGKVDFLSTKTLTIRSSFLSETFVTLLM